MRARSAIKWRSPNSPVPLLIVASQFWSERAAPVATSATNTLRPVALVPAWNHQHDGGSDKVAVLHSITSSAIVSSVGETLTPRPLAVLRLTAS